MRPPNPTPRAHSILAVDFGNVYTRANLIDLVDGVYSIVGQASGLTTAGFPAGDISIGLLRLLRQLGTITGRRLAEPDGIVITPERDDGTGVDSFIATASIGRPLRTVLIGLAPDVSVASGLRAASGTYVQVIDTLVLGGERSLEQQLNAIVLARPDLIFLVGGTEGGAEGPVLEQARLAASAIRLMPVLGRPFVLYAGNTAVVPEIEALFKPLTTVLIAANVRPSMVEEALADAQLQLARAFGSQAMRRGAGFERVAAMTRSGLQPNASGYDTIARYLGASEAGRRGAAARGILIADLGSASSVLAASVRGVTATTIRTDIGLGHSAETALAAVGIEAVRAWLPFQADDEQIANYALNKSLRPSTLPADLRELYLEHALLRAALQTLLDNARPLWTPRQALDDAAAPLPPFARIIGAGAGLCQTGRAGMAAMLLLDAFQPRGITRLQLDEQALIPALGALARENPEAVVQLLEGQALQTLGTALSLSGQPRSGTTAARVRITSASGERETFTVAAGRLWHYPLALGVRARIVVTAGRGLTIGGQRSVRLEVEGGTAGLIIDARGRPLPLAISVAGRAVQLPAWLAQATGDPVQEIPPAWLERRARPDQGGARSERDTTRPDEPARPSRRRRKERQPQAKTPAPEADVLLDEALSAFNTPDTTQSSDDDLRSRLGAGKPGTGWLRTQRRGTSSRNRDDELFP